MVFMLPVIGVRCLLSSTFVYADILAQIKYLSYVMRKPTFWFPTWSDKNQAVQLQKMARGLKFRT